MSVFRSCPLPCCLVPQSRRFDLKIATLDLPVKVLLQERDGVFDEENTESSDLVVGDILDRALVEVCQQQLQDTYQLHCFQNGE